MTALKKTARKKTVRKKTGKTSKRQTKANQCCVLWGACPEKKVSKKKTKAKRFQSGIGGWVVAEQPGYLKGEWAVPDYYKRQSFPSKAKALAALKKMLREGKNNLPLGVAKVRDGEEITGSFVIESPVEIVWLPPLPPRQPHPTWSERAGRAASKAWRKVRR